MEDIAGGAGLSENGVESAMGALIRRGILFRLARNRYAHRGAIEEARDLLMGCFERDRALKLGFSAFKGVLGVSCTHAKHYLRHFELEEETLRFLSSGFKRERNIGRTEMGKAAVIAIMVLGAFAFAVGEPVEAQCGGGGCGPGGSGGDGPSGEESEYVDQEPEGTIHWIPSAGLKAPASTGLFAEKDEETGTAEEIFELAKACEAMMPILVFFAKSADEQEFGKKGGKDPESAACADMDKDLWKRWVLAELAKDFVCVRVDVAKADAGLLRKHSVARAPVVVIYDFRLKPLYFASSPRLGHTVLSKAMKRTRMLVEKTVRKLAGSEDESKTVKRARARVQVLDQRDCYDEGLKHLEKRDWARANEAFKRGVEIDRESAWQDKCSVGLAEIEAGKIFVQAEKLIKQKRYQEALVLLQKIMVNYKEAAYFGALAKEKADYAAKKLK
jgi:predicted transcriptional regulator